MAVEAPGPISALNPAWPLEADEVREGAAHIRLIKDTLQIQFSNLNAAVPRTPDEMNALVGASEASPLQAQIDALQAQINALDKPQVGDLKFSANGSPGVDWTPCDFSERTRGDALWSVIGTTFGDGDGSATYNVPDYRGRGPKGSGDLDGNASKPYVVGAKGGADAVLLTGDQSGLRDHVHSGNYRNRNKTVGDPGSTPGADNELTTNTSGIVGGAQDALETHENRSPYTVCYVYIRFQVTTA